MFYPFAHFLTTQEFLELNERSIKSLPVMEQAAAFEAISVKLRQARQRPLSHLSPTLIELTIPVNHQLTTTRRHYCWALSQVAGMYPEKQPLTMCNLLESRCDEIPVEALEILATLGVSDQVENIIVVIPDDIRHATSPDCYRIELKIWLAPASNRLRAA